MRTFAVMGYLFAAAAACGDPLTFSSGTARVDVIELYTSEGCSSCPSADHWLGELRGKPGLWKEFVPLAFHVSYWDGLGWKDRLSSREYTDREYAYASAWGSRNVYTPCFVRNGQEWRPLWGGISAPAPAAGVLALSLGADHACSVDFTPAQGSRAMADTLVAHVAILAGGISSKVTAGENSGETLDHEFAVVCLVEGALESEGGALRGRILLPRPSTPDAKRHALAAWVTRRGSVEPLQATGGWIP